MLSLIRIFSEKISAKETLEDDWSNLSTCLKLMSY